MNYQAFCRTEIVFNTKDQLIRCLSTMQKNLVLMVSESASKRWSLSETILKLHEQAQINGFTFVWISLISENPTQEDVFAALQEIGSQPVDLIVAIGGGSVIDLAKGVSAFLASENKQLGFIEKSIKTKSYVLNRFVDIIAIPTTAGTGSEVTQWATIWDRKRRAKHSIDDPGLQPKLAIIVPELTLTLPPTMILSTGFDAMSQAVEAYWSKHTNPIAQGIALLAIEMVIDNLRVALDEPDNLEVRERLCVASVLSGLSFAKTRTTACHSISYPLTMFHGIPHGIAASITLDGVGRKNRMHFPNDTVLFRLFDQHGGIRGWVEAVSSDIVEMRLSTFGVNKSDLPRIVDNAFTAGRMDNNPVNLTKRDVFEILCDVL